MRESLKHEAIKAFHDTYLDDLKVTNDLTDRQKNILEFVVKETKEDANRNSKTGN